MSIVQCCITYGSGREHTADYGYQAADTVTAGQSKHWNAETNLWYIFNPSSTYHLFEELDQYCKLQWRHNKRDGVLNHRCIDCLLNPLFERRSKKTSKLRVTSLCEGDPPDKGPLTRKKMLPFDDVIITCRCHQWLTVQYHLQTKCCLQSQTLY